MDFKYKNYFLHKTILDAEPAEPFIVLQTL